MKNVRHNRPNGENIIKADVILGAFNYYRKQSKLYRTLKVLKVVFVGFLIGIVFTILIISTEHQLF